MAGKPRINIDYNKILFNKIINIVCIEEGSTTILYNRCENHQLE